PLPARPTSSFPPNPASASSSCNRSRLSASKSGSWVSLNFMVRDTIGQKFKLTHDLLQDSLACAPANLVYLTCCDHRNPPRANRYRAAVLPRPRDAGLRVSMLLLYVSRLERHGRSFGLAHF